MSSSQPTTDPPDATQSIAMVAKPAFDLVKAFTKKYKRDVKTLADRAKADAAKQAARRAKRVARAQDAEVDWRRKEREVDQRAEERRQEFQRTKRAQDRKHEGEALKRRGMYAVAKGVPPVPRILNAHSGGNRRGLVGVDSVGDALRRTGSVGNARHLLPREPRTSHDPASK